MLIEEKIEPEISFEKIKIRAVRGVIALTGRTFVLQVIAFIATILILPLLLEPSEYGTFILISAVINFFAYFSDIGLAAALIQKKEQLTDQDLRTTFTVQQTLVVILIITIFLVSPILKNWYGLGSDSLYLLWALAGSLLLSSLKTIPSVILERQLEFNKLIIPQIVETLFFYTCVVLLAYQGFGVTSFTIGVLVRGVSGLVAMYLINPWVPGFAWSPEVLKKLFKFGLPYQGNTLLAVFKDDGMTSVLGIILGASGIGLLGWALKWGSAPLRFFMDQIIKVTFPAYSRIQDDPARLSVVVSKSIFFICATVFPCLVLLVTVAPLLMEVFPKYLKWQPAVAALFFISINTAWASVTTPLTNALNATGKVTVTFRLMVMWTVLSWLILPALSYLYGVNGAAIGYALLGCSSIVALRVAAKYIKVDYIISVLKPLFGSIVMGLILLLLRVYFPVSLFSFILLVILGLSVYAFSMYIIMGQDYIKSLYTSLVVLKNRSV